MKQLWLLKYKLVIFELWVKDNHLEKKGVTLKLHPLKRNMVVILAFGLIKN